eukprot:5393015-Pleurochrysis_carterae.AAC.1
MPPPRPRCRPFRGRRAGCPWRSAVATPCRARAWPCPSCCPRSPRSPPPPLLACGLPSPSP